MNNKLQYRGLIGTILFHSLIVLMLFSFGFSTPLPLPKEQGILITFGNTMNGLGNTQASTSKKDNTSPSKNIIESSKSKPSKNNSRKILTQDIEDAPSIKSGKAKKEIKKPKKKRDLKKIKELKENKRLKKEIARKKWLQKERIRKLKEEEKRIKAESIKQEKERQAKIKSINNKAKSMFGRKSGNNSGNSGNSTGKGNIGNPKGSLNGNYNGSGKDGVSYSLNGRSALELFKPNNTFQKSGKVIVSVVVNQQGKVIRATAGAIGTNTHNAKLHKLAEQAALKTKFNIDTKATFLQKGTITYIFIIK